MPVTVKVVDHLASAWKAVRVSSPEKLLEAACPKQWRRCERIEQSSFTESLVNHDHVSASENGFVWAAYHAYSDHHHLVIRPEDIWFAILTQLSFYINAHAEDLRAFVVPHQGKKELEAISDIRDFALLTMQMADLLEKNVNDPQLRGWVMPDFTTTTYHDKVVGAVLFMGAMQAYFDYKMTITCGLPSITLLGELSDWQKILKRLDLIDQLGDEPRQFAAMMRPILAHMILTFEEPANAEVTSFWNRILHRHHVGSGTDYLSGWLTAFCFWDDEGKPKQFQSMWSREERNVLFDDIEYPYVDIDKVPLGYASVPVHVNGNGHEYEATMIAGSVGIAALSSNASVASSSLMGEQAVLNAPSTEDHMPVRDTIQPVSGWWIFQNEAKEQAEAREAEIKRLSEALDRERPEFGKLDSKALEDYFESEQYEEWFRMSRRLEELEAF